MTKAYYIKIITNLCICMLATNLYAHSGGTNSEGCHTKKSTGEYHCHGGGSRSPQIQTLLNSSGGSNYYKNCTQARAAGVTPLRRGDSGYRKGLDRDRDGIACE